jgi:hypothetical protein
VEREKGERLPDRAVGWIADKIISVLEYFGVITFSDSAERYLEKMADKRRSAGQKAKRRTFFTKNPPDTTGKPVRPPKRTKPTGHNPGSYDPHFSRRIT